MFCMLGLCYFPFFSILKKILSAVSSGLSRSAGSASSAFETYNPRPSNALLPRSPHHPPVCVYFQPESGKVVQISSSLSSGDKVASPKDLSKGLFMWPHPLIKLSSPDQTAQYRYEVENKQPGLFLRWNKKKNGRIFLHLVSESDHWGTNAYCSHFDTLVRPNGEWMIWVTRTVALCQLSSQFFLLLAVVPGSEFFSSFLVSSASDVKLPDYMASCLWSSMWIEAGLHLLLNRLDRTSLIPYWKIHRIEMNCAVVTNNHTVTKQ